MRDSRLCPRHKLSSSHTCWPCHSSSSPVPMVRIASRRNRVYLSSIVLSIRSLLSLNRRDEIAILLLVEKLSFVFGRDSCTLLLSLQVRKYPDLNLSLPISCPSFALWTSRSRKSCAPLYSISELLGAYHPSRALLSFGYQFCRFSSYSWISRKATSGWVSCSDIISIAI
jgi:hypothetical protein